MKKLLIAVLAISFAATSQIGGATTNRAIAPNDLLQILPDGNGVVLLDIKRVTSSGLWATISSHDPIKSALNKAQIETSEIGVKLSDLSSLATVLPASGAQNAVVAVTGTFSKGDLLSRLRADQKVRLTTETYKNNEIHKIVRVAAAKPEGKARSEEVAFSFSDDFTVLLGSVIGVRSAIDVRVGEKASAAQNQRLTSALAECPAGAAQFAILLTRSMTGAIQSSNLPLPDFSTLTMAFGAVDFTDAIDLNVTLRSDTPEHSKAIADQLNGLLGMVKGLLGTGAGDPRREAVAAAAKALTIANVGADVKISGNLSAELLDQVLGHKRS